MFRLSREHEVYTHCKTGIVHPSCYVNCGCLGDNILNLLLCKKAHTEAGPGFNDSSFASRIRFAAKVTLTSGITSTNFKLAAIFDAGSQLDLTRREEEKFTLC